MKQVESSHSMNVAKAEKIHELVIECGQEYNPSRAALKASEILLLTNKSKDCISAVLQSRVAYRKAIDRRNALFIITGATLTRVRRSLLSLGLPPEFVERISALLKRYRGIRVSKKLSEKDLQALAAAGQEVQQISASHTGYEQRIQTFEEIIKYLLLVAEYQPNEPELQVSGLTSLFNDLRAAHKDVIHCETLLLTARINRNNTLYDEHNGLVPVCIAVKNYLSGMLGLKHQITKKAFKLGFRKAK